jgi:hypothetical protein
MEHLIVLRLESPVLLVRYHQCSLKFLRHVDCPEHILLHLSGIRRRRYEEQVLKELIIHSILLKITKVDSVNIIMEHSERAVRSPLEQENCLQTQNSLYGGTGNCKRHTLPPVQRR